MKKIILLMTVIAMFFVFAPFSFADTDIGESEDGIVIEKDADILDPNSASCSLAFEKSSSTAAKAQAVASRSGASSITSTIYLQKKNGDSYSSVSNNKKTVQATRINHIHTFTIKSGNTYRIKVVIKYTKNGSSYSNTFYKKLS